MKSRIGSGLLAFITSYLGGSGYVIYGGGPNSKNVKITGNKITTRWWTNGGNFGPFTYEPPPATATR